MTRQWAFSGPPSADGFGASSVTLIEGSTFCISGPGGDIVPGGSQGLFVRDTRVVSRWELTLDGTAPSLLTVQHGEPFAATFLSRVPPRPGLADSTLLVVRRRHVGEGMREDVSLRNDAPHPVTCAVVLTADTDFADLFEVKQGWVHPRRDVRTRTGDSHLHIVWRGGGHEHGVFGAFLPGG